MFVARLSDATRVNTWVSKHNGSQEVAGHSQYVLVPGPAAPTGPEIVRVGPVQVLAGGTKVFCTDKVIVKTDQKRTAVWIRNAFPGHNSVIMAKPTFKGGGPGVTSKSWTVWLTPHTDPEATCRELNQASGVVYAEPNRVHM